MLGAARRKVGFLIFLIFLYYSLLFFPQESKRLSFEYYVAFWVYTNTTLLVFADFRANVGADSAYRVHSIYELLHRCERGAFFFLFLFFLGGIVCSCFDHLIFCFSLVEDICHMIMLSEMSIICQKKKKIVFVDKFWP